MLTLIISLVPAAAASVFIFGINSLLLMATCIITSVATEYIFNMLCHKPQTIGDLSAVVTGLLLAFNVPSTFPLWMAAVGSVAAIAVVKMLFGGIGQNFANPAITARIILLVSFAGPMTNFMIPQKGLQGGIELVAGSTPLALNALGDTASLPSTMDMFLGLRGGSLGETCILALLAGGIFLIVRKVISPLIPVSYLATVAVFALLVGQDPVFHILAGGVVLGAFYMATDYTTSPVTDQGKIIFGIGCGLITMLIRVFGSYPEGTSFAILLMNIITPHIDNLTKTKPFGGVK